MISFNDITKLFSYDLKDEACIEIEFAVKGFSDFQSCWMGKMPDKTDKEREVYWYGLSADNSEIYEYDNHGEFLNAPVFDGKSLKEIWNHISVLSIDGCDPEERIKFYIC